MPKISRLEVIATGSRRRWTPEEKQRIVCESMAVPRIVSATARRHGLSNSQLFTWRRLAREGKLFMEGDPAGFVPAVVMPDQGKGRAPAEPLAENTAGASVDSRQAAGRMEIVLSGARRVIVGSDVDGGALRRVIDAVERR